MSRQAVSGQTHILRALGKWPTDTIRPELQFQVQMQKRFEQPQLDMSEKAQLRQANALYSLLDNRYKRGYPIAPIAGTILQPKSDPTYFKKLLTELEEAPTRSWFDRFKLRIGGIVRLNQ
ncbi:hypothetical protein F4808DRAFT_454490 [Astrocystis sublimbata]|nr:hypothetical protein F4808DRAFT_454490 [Astrocystis sublimbata]